MQLKEYQQIIKRFIVNNKRCAVFCFMGAGKTISTLTALEDVALIEDVYPALILAPLRVAQSTWPNEVRKWPHTRHLRVSPIVGTAQERILALRRHADIYTINYENLPWLVELMGESWKFKTVVADESTRLKNFRTRQGGMRSKALGTIAFTKINRFIELTGTPAPNGLADLWGQMWFVDAGVRLGRTYASFFERWFRCDYDGRGTVPFKHSDKEIHASIKDLCINIDAKDWFDVEEPIVTNLFVTLPPMARSLYKDMEKRLFMEIEGHQIEAFTAATKTQKLLQLSSGAVYLDKGEGDSGARKWKSVHEGKLDALESIVEEANGAPILVAYHFKSDLARLLKRFPKGKALDKNPRTEADWCAGKIPVLFAHPACLHPLTEVLTELRGWVKLIEVSITDRVFDGVEFVTHQGCSYSGYSEVVDVFGITMTLNHKLLIAGIWVGAKDVRTGESARREAIYTYKGDDKYLSEMLTLRGNIGDTRAEFKKAQPSGAQALPALYRGDVPSDDQHPILGYLEGDTEQNQRPNGQKLWWAGYTGVRGMAGLQYFLHRYVRGLLSWLNDRAGRCQRRLLEGQLSLGYQHGTASQQTHQQVLQLSGRDNSPRRALSQDRAWKNGDMCPLSGREVNRRSDTKREELYVRDEPTGYQKKAQVYDLVDCGPRSRFVIRNADGDVFISHNSAGHGLNLQTGGNILVYFSHDWNLEYRMQILERIGPVRQLQAGLDRPVFVYNIIGADTADELVIARTESKREVQDLLLEAVRRRK